MYYLYKITNTNNTNVYIGYTVNPSKRWYKHRWTSAKPKQHLHLAMHKYGSHTFEMEVIACCKFLQDAKETEMTLIIQYDSFKNGYNSTVGGDGLGSGVDNPFFGKKLSPERVANMKKPRSKEFADKLRQVRTGWKLSEETKKKIGDKHRGRKHSKEYKQKCAERLSKNRKGRTWKLIDGKRKWMDKPNEQ
jgi:group I intron endonuclease